MKKILGIVVLGLLLCSNVYSDSRPVRHLLTGDEYHIYGSLPKGIKDSWAKNNPDRLIYGQNHCSKFKKNTYTFAYQGIEDRITHIGQDSYRFICARTPQGAVDALIKAMTSLNKSPGTAWQTKYQKKIGKMNMMPNINHIQFSRIEFSDKELEKYIKEDVLKAQEQNQKIITQASDQMKEDIKPFKSMCKNIGYMEGTEKFADCVKDLYLKKLDAQKQSQSQTTITSTPKRRIDPSVWDDLLNISKGMSEGKSFTESLGGVSSSSGSRKITCFKTGEETGGLNKICRYDCVGNLVTTTVGAAQMCPIQIQR